MVGVGYDDPKWDQFLNQLTWDELIGLTVNSGSYGSGSSERFEKPKGSAPDGAHGLSVQPEITMVAMLFKDVEPFTQLLVLLL